MTATTQTVTRTHTLGVIMNGVTGRMGTHQHLMRSLIAIRQQGGVRLPNGDTILPDPVLVGRNAASPTSFPSLTT